MSDPHKHAADDAELTDYADLVNNLRAGEPIEPVQPSAAVWDNISAAIDSPGERAPVIDLGAARERSRGRTAAILVAVAAAFLLIAVPAGLALRGGEDDVELASAQLLVLDETVGVSPATASLISKDGSDLGLELETDDIATEGSDFAELWLLRVNDDGSIEPVSLGRADGSGWYDIDDELDLSGSWLVDVSIEPDDGDHEHSGRSVLQGDLS